MELAIDNTVKGCQSKFVARADSSVGPRLCPRVVWLFSCPLPSLSFVCCMNNLTRDILLRTGGVLVMGGALAALICYCHRKKRGV